MSIRSRKFSTAWKTSSVVPIPKGSMPTECDLSFMEWWKMKTTDYEVQVWYPHSQHGNAGKPSNRAKWDAKSDFLEFIDCNSQPNGRSEESLSATNFFLPKLRTIQTPKDGVPRYEQHLRESLVGEFNHVQREKGRDTISNYSIIRDLLGSRKKDLNMLSHHTS